MPRKGELKIEFRRIDGVDHRICRGPIHRKGVWLPVGMFHLRGDKSGRPKSSCKWCDHWYRYRKNYEGQLIGYVPLRLMRFAVVELENRLGRVEAARRAGVGKTTWYRWVHGKGGDPVQRRSVEKVFRALSEVRTVGEVRSRRGIRYGYTARGREEPPVLKRDDLYRPHGDLDNQRMRQSRRSRG